MAPKPSEIAVHKPKRTNRKDETRIQRDGSLPEKPPSPKLVEVANAKKLLLDAGARPLVVAMLIEAIGNRDEHGNVTAVAVKAGDVILAYTDPPESQESGEVTIRVIHEPVIVAI